MTCSAPLDSQTGVLSLYTADNEDAPTLYTIRERTYRKVLGDALGDQLGLLLRDT